MLSHHRASELSLDVLTKTKRYCTDWERLFWDVSNVTKLETTDRITETRTSNVCLAGSGLVVTLLLQGLHVKWKSILCFIYIICDRLCIYMFLYYIIISFIYYLYFNVILYRSLDLNHGFCAWVFFSWYLVLHNCF